MGQQDLLLPITLIQDKLLILTWYSRQALFALLHASLEVREIQGFTYKCIMIADSHSISERTGHVLGRDRVGTEKTALFRAKCQITVPKQPYNKGSNAHSKFYFEGWEKIHPRLWCVPKRPGWAEPRHRNNHSTKLEKLQEKHYAPLCCPDPESCEALEGTARQHGDSWKQHRHPKGLQAPLESIRDLCPGPASEHVQYYRPSDILSREI